MKTLSNQAQAAKLIRKELKAAFPGTKFSVTSESYSMGDAVWVRWSNGPDAKDIYYITDKYECGKFDGMTDTFDFSNRRQDIPQTMFVHTQKYS